MPSANTLLTLLFSEAISINFVSILPSCTSSLVTSKDRILFFLDASTIKSNHNIISYMFVDFNIKFVYTSVSGGATTVSIRSTGTGGSGAGGANGSDFSTGVGGAGSGGVSFQSTGTGGSGAGGSIETIGIGTTTGAGSAAYP
jgi:hypothetical protein